MNRYDPRECESSVTTDDSSTVRSLTRLLPEDIRHVTCAVTVDVSELNNDEQERVKVQSEEVVHCFSKRLSERTTIDAPSRPRKTIANCDDDCLLVEKTINVAGLTDDEKRVAHRLAREYEDIIMSLVERVTTTVSNDKTVREVVKNARSLSLDDEQVSIGDDRLLPVRDDVLTSLLFAVHKRESTRGEIVGDVVRIVAFDDTYMFQSDGDYVEIRIIADTDTHEIRRLTVTPRLSGASSWTSTSATSDTVATTDGGLIVADDDGEILTESDDERPDDCQCTPAIGDLPCWPCYRDGFQTPADDA